VHKTLTPRKLIAILEKQGFLLKRIKGSHYVFQHPQTRRRITIAMHAKDLPNGTLHEILKQAGISKEDV